MRTLKTEFKGFPISLLTKEYEQLLRRFSPDNYDLYDGSPSGDNKIVASEDFDIKDHDVGYLYYQNAVPCPLCMKCTGCKRCTFHKFENVLIDGKRRSPLGCTNVLITVLLEAKFPYFTTRNIDLDVHYAFFAYANKDTCFKQLKLMNDWLKINFGEVS